MKTDSERLASIETTVLDLKHFVMGNGQPGVIEKHDERISRLENWRWWVVGIAIGLGVGAGGIGMKLIEALAK